MPLKDTLASSLCKAVNDANFKKVEELIRSPGFSFSRMKNGGYGLLKQAINNKFLEVAKLLLQEGVRVNSYENYESNTVLHVATENGYTELVAMLINKNANIDVRSDHKRTPLHIATAKRHEMIIRLLLNGGADSSLKDRHGMEPLHIALREGPVKIIELLLHFRMQKKYSDPQILNLALLMASKWGIEHMIPSLLNAGADPNAIIDPHTTELMGLGEYPSSNLLHFACEKSYEGIIEVLLKHGAKINCSRLKDGYEPLHIASQGDNENIVRVLLNNGADFDAKADGNVTPLLLAAKKNNFKIVEMLVNSGANVNAQTCEGCTPLHLTWEHYTRPDAAVKITAYLLSHGADPNIKAEDNVTPLHSVAKRGNFSEAQMLLSNGANVDSQTRKGFTPLHLVSDGYSDAGQTVHLFLSAGADPNIQVDGGITPLHFAVKKGGLKKVTALLNGGANINAQTTEGSTPLLLAAEHSKNSVVKILLEQGACVNTADENNYTPLYFAVERRNRFLISCILPYKPHINEITKKSIFRSIACRSDYRPVVDYLMECGFVMDEEDMKDCNLLPAAVDKGYTKIVQYILNSGVDPNSAEYGSTLLHHAVARKHEEILRSLLSSGCNVNTDDGKGNTPICYAFSHKEESECMELIQLLIAHGAVVKKVPKLLLRALDKNFFKVAKIISDNGADINALDDYTIKFFHRAMKDRRMKVVYILLVLGVDVNSRSTVDESTALHYACMWRYKQLVEYLCRKGADVNAQNEDGSTALHLAFEYRNIEIVEYLCRKGADVNTQNKHGSTALHLACLQGYNEIEYLFLEGADVHAQKKDFAIQHRYKEIVEYLCRKGADVNAQNEDGSTALHLAFRNKEIVEYLCRKGADVNAQNKHGSTALHLACEHGNKEMVDYLCCKGADVNARNKDGSTALHLAVELRMKEALNYFEDITPRIEDTAFLRRVREIKETVEYLCCKGADVNSQNKDGLTALHLACKYWNEELVEYLCCKGADLNAQNKDGLTALHLACQCGHKAIVEYLCCKGADLNIQNKEGSTALHLAFKCGHKKIVEVLCCKGADINAQNKDGLTALHLACQDRHKAIVEYLCCKGADLNIQNKDGSTALHLACQDVDRELVEALCCGGADTNAQDNDGSTALHLVCQHAYLEAIDSWDSDWAVLHEYEEIVKILLKNKADANLVRMKDGLRPLHIAASNGFVEIVKVLLDFGAEIDAQGFENETALHSAVTEGQDRVVQFLLENGCDINLENERQETALHVAISKFEAISSGSRVHLSRRFIDGNPRSCYELIIGMLDKFLIQFKVAGLFINSNLLNRVGSSGKFNEECEEEVQRMKNEVICDHITFHDILVCRNNPTYAKNESLMQILESYDYSKFQIYGNLTMVSFKNSKVRNELLASGQKSFDFLVKISNVLNDNKLPILPPEILENILLYLNTKDLKNLIFCVESINKQLI